MERNGTSNLSEDYSIFNDIPLQEVENFFNKKAFQELITNGITNLGELFTKEANGELIKIFVNHQRRAFELWRTVLGSISILKCKYLNQDPEIYDYVSGSELADKLGIMHRRAHALRSLNIASLMLMVENNNFTELYRLFSVDKANEIISKIRIIYNFRKSKSQSKSTSEETSIEELNILYEELRRLKDEHQRIGEEIDITIAKINARTQATKGNGGVK